MGYGWYWSQRAKRWRIDWGGGLGYPKYEVAKWERPSLREMAPMSLRARGKVIESWCDRPWTTDPIFRVIGVQPFPADLRGHPDVDRDWETCRGDDGTSPVGASKRRRRRGS